MYAHCIIQILIYFSFQQQCAISVFRGFSIYKPSDLTDVLLRILGDFGWYCGESTGGGKVMGIDLPPKIRTVLYII
jgi:hypothetical protein